MPSPDARRARVRPLYELLAGVDSVQDFLADLAHVAAEEIDRELSCGLTVQVEGRPMTIASSDDLASCLDAVQYDAGDGPSLKAMATGGRVDVPDLAGLDRWPAWRDLARSRGVRKALSVPLPTGDASPLGGVNLYSTSSDKFTQDDFDTADAFAEHAAGALKVAIRLVEQAELLGHMQTALESRAVIDQAKGILMAQERCTADEAFELLRTASQHRNTKLSEIARGIVARVSRSDPGTPS